MEATQTPPPSGGEAETLLAVAKEEKAKRARKRSRYLSPPYTHHHDGSTVDDDIAPPEQASLLLQLQKANVAAADLLSALLHSAASASASPPSPNVDADVLLRFFALHRTSMLAKLDSSNQGGVKDAAGHRLPHACRAMVVAHGSAAKNVKKEDHAMGHAYARPVNAGASALEAGHKRKKVTFASDGHNATTDCSVQPTSGVANSAPKKKKKARKTTGHAQHFGNPAALVLNFTQDTIHLPSKKELLSAFRRFGFLIESQTDIHKDARRARVVFGSSAEAETAYSCAQTLGTFGPPFAVPSLQYLPPIKLDAPRSLSPAPKLPLTDIRKNLEKMISALTRPSSFSKDGAHNLVGQMQGLLAKVDKLMSAGPSTATAHHH